MKKLIFSILLLFPTIVFSQGASDPLTKIDLTRQVKNILPVVNGGTGVDNLSSFLQELLPGCYSDGANGLSCSGSATFGTNLTVNGIPKFTAIKGSSTTCLQISNTGVISNTGAPCGTGGGGGITNFYADPTMWPSWLIPTVINPTSAPSLQVTASTIPIYAGGTGANNSADGANNLISGQTISPLNVTITSLGTAGIVTNDSSGNLGTVSVIPIANGGNGTSTPSISGGTGVTVTGSWPNYTISGAGGTVTSFTANAGSWPSWFVPSVSNSTSTPTLTITTHTIPISAGGTGAATAPIAAYNITSGQSLTPASVVATGDISGMALTDSGLSTAGIVTNDSSGNLGTVSVIPVVNGGLGTTAITGLIYGNGTTYAAASSANVLGVIGSGAITNTYLANTAITVNSQTCTLGSSCTIPFQTNGTNNTSQAGLNFLTSTTNSVGLTITPVNSATNNMKFEITGTIANSTTTSAISGMNSTQVAIAGSANTITSSKALAGTGSGITTGTTTSVSGDIVTFTGTGGQIQDSSTLLSSLAPLASPAFTGTPTFASGFASTTAGTGFIGSTTKWFSGIYLGTGTSYYTFLSPATPTASYTLTIPTLSGADTIATLGLAQTFSGAITHSAATTTFGASGTTTGILKIASSGTGGSVSITPASATSAYTATLPANTGTIAELNFAQTWSAVQTFSSAPVISTITNTGTLTLPTTTGTLALTSQIPTGFAFSAITAGTNTSALLIGTGGSLGVSGTGTINANQINGSSIAASTNVFSSNSSSQLIAGTAHNLSVPTSCSTSGSSNAYTCTTTPTFTPAAGDRVQILFNNTNTATATLSVNSQSPATIKKWGGSGNLISGDIQATHYISAYFDGTYWQLEGQLGNSVLSGTPTSCTLPQVATGISANGNAICSQPSNVTGTAVSLSGTVVDSIPYQSASATTSYISPYSTNGFYVMSENVIASTAVAPALVSIISSSTNAVGLTVTPTYSSSTERFEITGTYNGSAGSVANALTFNSSGSGAVSGSTFNGSSAVTISYNTIGAQVAGSYATTSQLPSTIASVSHKYLTSYTSTTETFTSAQPVSADLSDLGTASGAAQLNSSGYLPVAQGGLATSAITGLIYGNGTTYAAASASNIVTAIGINAVTNSTNTTNLLGTVVDSIPYQSTSATTSYISPQTTNGTYMLAEVVTASTAVAPTLISASTTVNGVTCTIGSTCTISASAGSLTIGTTTIASGTSNGLLYDNAGNLGNLATANNGVLITSGTGVPAISSTLPSGLSAPSLTVTTAFTATGLVTLADLSTITTNTILGNATSGTASPTALAITSCSTSSSALIWTTNTGFGCNTSINSTTTSAISGMTSTQVAIAGSANTITSSKALAGSGSGITTGPTTSVSGDIITFSGTSGQIQDSSTLLSSLAPLASPAFTGTPTFASGFTSTTAGTGFIGSTTKWFSGIYLGTGTSYYTLLSPATPTASYTLTIPTLSGADTIATLGLAQTFSGAITHSAATTTFGASGTTTGILKIASSGAGGSVSITPASATSAYTATLPANTGTIAELNFAQTWSAVQTFSSAPVISTITNTGTLTLPTTTGTLATTSQLPTTIASASHKYLTSYTSTTETFTSAQPVSADLSDLGTASGAAQLNSSGYLPVAQGGLATSAITGLIYGNGTTYAAASAINLSTAVKCTTANTANAYTCTTTPTFTPAAGVVVQVIFNATNTGSATLSVNGQSAATIKKLAGTGNLVSGDIQAGHYISAAFDGTYWQLEGQLGNSLLSSYPSSGIVVSTGTAWGTSLTAPASTIVGISDTQTLTNKSIAGSEINSGTIGISYLPTGTTSSNIVVGGVITGAGPIGSATAIPVITYNNAGQLTLVSTVTPTVNIVNSVSFPASPSTNTVPVVTSSNTITYEAVPNAALANSVTTVNGITCTLGSTCASYSETSPTIASNAVTLIATSLVTANYINLTTTTGNVTGTMPSGTAGQQLLVNICQDATGGHTFTWAGSVRGAMVIGTTASTCSSQIFYYSATKSSWIAFSAGVINQ